jgi:hypothetical protein
VALLAVFGYLGGGLIYAKLRLDDADGAYNTAVQDQDQDSIAQLINSFKGSSAPANAAAVSSAQFQHDRDVLAKWVTDSESARGQIAVDDQSLADATAGLGQDRWLIPMSVASFDRTSRRIAAERRVLADARPIVTYYVQVGSFFVSLIDIGLDFNSISASVRAGNLSAADYEITKVRADAAKAISFDKAPGLPPEADQVVRLMQVIDGDFSNVLNAGIARNASALNSAINVGRADIARLQAIDTTKLVTKIEAFYAPMIDAYHADVAKARAA